MEVKDIIENKWFWFSILDDPKSENSDSIRVYRHEGGNEVTIQLYKDKELKSQLKLTQSQLKYLFKGLVEFIIK
jgi:hypothetical protein